MNSDKIRDRINQIRGMDSSKPLDKIKAGLQFYWDFMNLLARNKVSSPAASAVTTLEMEGELTKILEEIQNPKAAAEKKAADEKVEKERLAAEKKAADEKLAAEKKAAAEKAAAEKAAAEKAAAEKAAAANQT